MAYTTKNQKKMGFTPFSVNAEAPWNALAEHVKKSPYSKSNPLGSLIAIIVIMAILFWGIIFLAAVGVYFLVFLTIPFHKVQKIIQYDKKSIFFFLDFYLWKLLFLTDSGFKKRYQNTHSLILRELWKSTPEEFKDFLQRFTGAPDTVIHTPSIEPQTIEEKPPYIPEKNTPSSYQAEKTSYTDYQTPTKNQKKTRSSPAPSGKSVWDDYESVIDIMNKNKK